MTARDASTVLGFTLVWLQARAAAERHAAMAFATHLYAVANRVIAAGQWPGHVAQRDDSPP